MFILQNRKEHHENWQELPDHPYKILIVGKCGSGKTNLINHDLHIDKIVLYAKNLNKAKYQLLINKRESIGLKYLIDSKPFIEYLFHIDDIYKNIEEYKQNNKQKILIVFDDTLADMLNKKKYNPVVAELFTRGRILNICLVFITQIYLAVPKNVQQKFQTKEIFNKLDLIVYQILTFKTLWIFMKVVLLNHIVFRLLIILLHQIVFHISERIF